MTVTPLWIEIAFHYAVAADCGDDFPRMSAPACREVIDEMKRLGLLEIRLGQHRAYFDTGGLRVWIEALCNVPLPTKKWVVA